MRYPFAALSVFAWVTVVFVVLDVVQVKFGFFTKWDPRTLPKLTKREPKTSMTESIAALVFGAIFGVWWLVGLKHQFLIFGPGVRAIHFGPVWQTLYPLFVVLVIADLVRHTVDVVRPGWEKGRIAFRMLFRGLNLLMLYFLIKAPDLLVPCGTGDPNLAVDPERPEHRPSHWGDCGRDRHRGADADGTYTASFGSRAGNGERAAVRL